MPFWVGSVGFAKVVTIAYDNEITVLLMSARFCCLFRHSLLAVGINKIKSVGNPAQSSLCNLGHLDLTASAAQLAQATPSVGPVR